MCFSLMIQNTFKFNTQLMKKTTLLIIVITFSQLSFSQEKWSVGLSFEPGTSGLTQRTEYGFSDTVQLYIGSNYSYSISGIVDFKVNNKFHISSGINYNKLSYSWGIKREYYDPEFLNLAANPNWLSNTYTTHYNLLSIPLNIQFNIKTFNKFDFYLKGGLSANYLFDTNTSVVEEYENETKDTSLTTHIKKGFKLSANIGVGLNYAINSRFKIVMEPSIEYFIKKTENTVPLNGHFYNIGVNFGIIYGL